VSAPVGVWAFRFVDGTWSAQDERHTCHARYLRADLTCGECVKMHREMVLDKGGWIRHLPGCEKYPSRCPDDPACMEFVAKE
jgi:hypothetical protein